MNEKILKQVRQLLALAESTTFPDEADTARATAERLIMVYGIERAMTERTDQKPGQVTKIEIKFGGAYTNRQSDLLFRVAKALGCETVTYHPPKSSRRSTRAMVVGFPDVLEQVELLYTSLLLQSTRDLDKLSGTRHTRAQRSAYLLGFADRAGERLEALYAQVVEESDAPGVALMLADRRGLVQAAFRKMFPNTTVSKRSPVNADGYNAGRKAANSADLGQERFGGGRQRALTS